VTRGSSVPGVEIQLPGPSKGELVDAGVPPASAAAVPGERAAPRRGRVAAENFGRAPPPCSEAGTLRRKRAFLEIGACDAPQECMTGATT